MMSIVVRDAVHEDAPAITECVKNAYQCYVERMGKLPGPMLNNYAEVIEQHKVYVAIRQDQVVGALVLMRLDNGLLLDNIAVDPQYQGLGVGKSLMQLAEERCRCWNYPSMQLYTHECMVENIELYQRCGWKIIDYREEHGFKRIYFEKIIQVS